MLLLIHKLPSIKAFLILDLASKVVRVELDLDVTRHGPGHDIGDGCLGKVGNDKDFRHSGSICKSSRLKSDVSLGRMS
jgi:hypothetical protein